MRVLPYAQFVCALAPLLSSTAHAEPGDLDTLAHMLLDRFQLENGCKPINLFVATSTGGPAGLTPESITVTVRSRLRLAGLYQPESRPYLAVLVTTIPNGMAFSIAVKFKKVLTDPLAPDGLKTAAEGRFAEGLATTWEREILGQSQDAGYILSGVSRLTDEFIDEYLRVNERTCPR